VDRYDALMISDIHMSNKLPESVMMDNDVTDRLRDQMKLWRQVKRSAEELKIDSIHALGDIFDQSRVDAVTLAATCAAVRSLSEVAHVYIQGGNHDAVSIHGGPFTVEFFGALKLERIHYVNGPGKVPTPDWLRFWPVPYGSVNRTRKRLELYRQQIKRGRRACEVLLLHHSILGCTHEGWQCDVGLTPEEAREGFDYTLSGHFHTTQFFGADGRGLYLGSPLHFRFDDAERKAGWWHISFFKDREWQPKFISSRLPRFRQVTWPEKLQKFRSGDYLRINLVATHAEYALLKPKAQAYCNEMIQAGVRAQLHHTPLYHHAKRLKPSKKGKASMLHVVDQYVDAIDVDTNGLQAKRLRDMGKQAIEAGRLKE
jgi:DNA repair exonuclease SbcCD nuclease subunit